MVSKTPYFDVFADLWSILSAAALDELDAACEAVGRKGTEIAPNEFMNYFNEISKLSPIVRVTNALALAQAIDNWAQPIWRRSKERRTDMHIAALVQLNKTGSLNTNFDLGAVVPRRSDWTTREEIDMEVNGPIRLFGYLQVLPKAIEAYDADDLPGASRGILVSYKPLPRTVRKLPKPPIRIAIAPILNALDDARIIINHRPPNDYYNIEPKSLLMRAEDALKESVANNVSFVMFPETVFKRDDLGKLQAIVKKTLKATSVCFVIAGLSSQGTSDKFGANEIVLLD